METVVAVLDFRSEEFRYFNWKSIPILPTKFPVNWHFGSEVQNIFARLQPTWISNGNDFDYFFLSESRFDTFKFQLNLSTGLHVQEKFKIHFQDGGGGGHVRFPMGTILAFLLFTSHRNTSCQIFSDLAFWFRLDFQSHDGQSVFDLEGSK